jgi:hypothetical protein
MGRRSSSGIRRRSTSARSSITSARGEARRVHPDLPWLQTTEWRKTTRAILLLTALFDECTADASRCRVASVASSALLLPSVDAGLAWRARDLASCSLDHAAIPRKPVSAYSAACAAARLAGSARTAAAWRCRSACGRAWRVCCCECVGECATWRAWRAGKQSRSRGDSAEVETAVACAAARLAGERGDSDLLLPDVAAGERGESWQAARSRGDSAEVDCCRLRCRSACGRAWRAWRAEVGQRVLLPPGAAARHAGERGEHGEQPTAAAAAARGIAPPTSRPRSPGQEPRRCPPKRASRGGHGRVSRFRGNAGVV